MMLAYGLPTYQRITRSLRSGENIISWFLGAHSWAKVFRNIPSPKDHQLQKIIGAGLKKVIETSHGGFEEPLKLRDYEE